MALTDCGVRPMCAITGMPASHQQPRSARCDRSPPSSFTAPDPGLLDQPGGACAAPATGPSWYEPKGRSPTIRARLVPRTTAADSIVISSRVTGHGRVVPEVAVARRVADQQHRDAGLVEDGGGHRVVGGEHRPLLAALLGGGEVADGDAAGALAAVQRLAAGRSPAAVRGLLGAAESCVMATAPSVISRRPDGVPGSPPWWHLVPRRRPAGAREYGRCGAGPPGAVRPVYRRFTIRDGSVSEMYASARP